MAEGKKDRRQEKIDRLEELAASKDRLARTKSGEDWELEVLVDYFLVQSRKNVTKHDDLRDFLSKSQLDLRRSREVMPTSGVPEEHLYKGLYRRAYNPTSRGSHSSNATPNLDGEYDV